MLHEVRLCVDEILIRIELLKEKGEQRNALEGERLDSGAP